MREPCRVIPLPYALACHSALLHILHEAIKRAVARGLLSHANAEELLTIGASRDCAVLRASVEVILGVLERSPPANAEASRA